MRTDYQFTAEQRQRYMGHLSLCEIDLPGQHAISCGRVLVVGAGGLGSPVALYLAAAGVGTIGVVDPDTVSLSNLQRQIMHGTADVGRPKVESAKESMRRINDNIEILTYPVRLTAENAPGLISGYDIVVDCTDSLESRLLVNDACVDVCKPYVHGSVSRFSGLVFTHIPGSACYRDIFDATPDGEETACSVNGIMNTVVGIVWCVQATEVLKYLAGTGELLTDRLLTFDALTMRFVTLSVSRDNQPIL